MSEWIQHDGKGVPKDAIVGVTIVRVEAAPFAPFLDGIKLRESRWTGRWPQVWDWSNFGKPAWGTGIFSRVIAYRNPSAASFRALEAIAADPKAKFRKLVDA